MLKRCLLVFFLTFIFSIYADPIYIAYYTVNTPYEEEVINLKNSLDQFSLPYDIQGVPSLGSWQRNTQYKTLFIRDMVNKYPDRPVVYVDADAIVRSPPIFFDQLECDVAVHHFYNKKRNFLELLSGTVYFGPTENAKKLIDKWIEVNQEFPDQWDQKNLDIAIKRMPELKIVELPPSYCLIFDTMKDQGPAVIEHFQASRRFKKIVNSN